jgi:hypothetical protein
MRLVSNTRLGKAATPETKQRILDSIEALEAMNPIPDPVDSNLLSGTWALLYNGADRVNDEEWRKKSGEVEGPFLSFFKPLVKGIIRTKGNTQVFDVSGGTLENLAVRNPLLKSLALKCNLILVVCPIHNSIAVWN